MITFRPTRLVARRLHVTVPTEVVPVTATHTDWYVNEFPFDRRRHMILTNSYSLLSVVMLGTGLTSADTFARAAVAALRDYLEATGNRAVFERHLAPAATDTRFLKPSDRRVLGSMNEMTFMATVHMAEGGLSPVAASRKANEAPLSVLWNRKGPISPDDAFQQMPELVPWT